MHHPRIVELVRRACAEAQALEPTRGDCEGTVPVSAYVDPRRFELERARLFRALPLPLAHGSEVPRGTVAVRELAGVSLLLARGADGVVRGFKNACRHRGVRLVREDCRAKAFVCPYHGWTYDTGGALIHVPHEAAFGGCELSGRNLVAVSVEERHGLVWVSLASSSAAPSVAAHLGDLDEEVGALELGSHVVGGRAVEERRGNWKMLVEAFLEGYHIRTLHRDTVYRFFLDARNCAERVGAHIRTASARRAAKDIGEAQLTELATFSYQLFPATTLIAHPDWMSLITVQPLATDRFLWSHTQLIPDAPTTDSARAHFERSFELIQGSVFAAEDLLMCAEAQAGLETGANESLVFGRLESPALWFHQALEAALA